MHIAWGVRRKFRTNQHGEEVNDCRMIADQHVVSWAGVEGKKRARKEDLGNLVSHLFFAKRVYFHVSTGKNERAHRLEEEQADQPRLWQTRSEVWVIKNITHAL